MRGKQKNWFMGDCLLAIIFVICTCISVCSCKEKGLHFNSDRPDSVYVAEKIEATVNPSFSSVETVKVFQARLKDEYAIDNIFVSLPSDVLNNVATVCLKQKPQVNKKDIVTEYRTHKEVYDNLSPDPITENGPQSTHSSIDTTTHPKNTVNYRDGTDTVNGKPYKVRIREERIYE